MKATKPILDRISQLKKFEVELIGMIKTREEKPANAFRYAIEQDENDQEISELEEIKLHLQRLLISIESSFE